MDSLKKEIPVINNEGKHGIPTVAPISFYETDDPDTVKFGNYNVLFKVINIKIADKECILSQASEVLQMRVKPTLKEEI
jgi:hypothetical protein